LGGAAPAGVTSTPLGDRLHRLIELNGPMSIADYMAHCLGDPEHGYYATRDPFGAAGDFLTAPEVSQMFGEMIGIWLVHTWRDIGAPAVVRLVELGPGRGLLMDDILRVAARTPDFLAALSVHLIETSPVLRAKQAEILKAPPVPLSWHATFEEVPEGPVLVIANEFLDALPIRQFKRVQDRWRELLVGLDRSGNFSFVIGPGSIDGTLEAPEGTYFEVAPAAEHLIGTMAGRITEQNGAALIVDYGYDHASGANTLQAVRGHGYASPLDAPGETDLTAHVDFAALASVAAQAGASAHGPRPQGKFLLAMGLRERAERLGNNADKKTRAGLSAAFDRLINPDQMGTLFKVMAITRRGMTPYPFGSSV
jgi:NADH dehydrogenase [ubiquinone] 1 alpha subcomplex assembly factor 7